LDDLIIEANHIIPANFVKRNNSLKMKNNLEDTIGTYGREALIAFPFLFYSIQQLIIPGKRRLDGGRRLAGDGINQRHAP
jgi:hypothetical protein